MAGCGNAPFQHPNPHTIAPFVVSPYRSKQSLHRAIRATVLSISSLVFGSIVPKKFSRDGGCLAAALNPATKVHELAVANISMKNIFKNISVYAAAD
ncbi:hypothetical protein [Gloeomargarita sp.]